MRTFLEWLIEEGKRPRPLPFVAKPPPPPSAIFPPNNPRVGNVATTGGFMDPTGKRIDTNAPGSLGDADIVRRVDRLQRSKITADPNMTLQQVRNAQVQFGKTIEGHILQQCVDVCGYDILPPTNEEDKYEKIDGWWDMVKWEHKKKKSQAPMLVAKEGQPSHQVRRVPIQIKYRDSGDDVLFEAIKPWRTMPLFSRVNRTGRDVKPPDSPMSQWNIDDKKGPQYIFHLSRDGTMLTIAKLGSCYQIIDDLLKEIDQTKVWGNLDQYTVSPRMFAKNVNGANCQVRLQQDGTTRLWKVVAYLPFRALQGDIIDRCNVNIPLL
jgi:hypothetical protein